MIRQQGYILVTVMVALVVLATVAARLDARVADFRTHLGRWQQWADDQSALISARDQVLFVMATRQLSQAGFGGGADVLRVDGRPYRLPSGVWVSVQDARGLISVSTPDPLVMRNVLLQHGVSDKLIEPLLDKLADYTDVDNLRRLNGAEADEYHAQKLAPPRNDWLISPYELRLVLGWNGLSKLVARGGDLFTVSRESWINPNTAPPEVLAALPGATPEGVKAALARRETMLFISYSDLLAATGIILPDDPVAFFPSSFYRLRLGLEHGLKAIEYHIILTPGAPTLPWQILETRFIDRPEQAAFDGAMPPFPKPLAATADE
ncbi:MAG: hypothetical protein EPN89_08860 [Methylovulum sp.]|nr:MAG: hypothetical protein EPN89_08860 [Methylovulum sp.]